MKNLRKRIVNENSCLVSLYIGEGCSDGGGCHVGNDCTDYGNSCSVGGPCSYGTNC